MTASQISLFTLYCLMIVSKFHAALLYFATSLHIFTLSSVPDLRENQRSEADNKSKKMLKTFNPSHEIMINRLV